MCQQKDIEMRDRLDFTIGFLRKDFSGLWRAKMFLAFFSYVHVHRQNFKTKNFIENISAKFSVSCIWSFFFTVTTVFLVHPCRYFFK